jgi:hypothetical protein
MQFEPANPLVACYKEAGPRFGIGTTPFPQSAHSPQFLELTRTGTSNRPQTAIPVPLSHLLVSLQENGVATTTAILCGKHVITHLDIRSQSTVSYRAYSNDIRLFGKLSTVIVGTQ